MQTTDNFRDSRPTPIVCWLTRGATFEKHCLLLHQPRPPSSPCCASQLQVSDPTRSASRPRPPASLPHAAPAGRVASGQRPSWRRGACVCLSTGKRYSPSRLTERLDRGLARRQLPPCRLLTPGDPGTSPPPDGRLFFQPPFSLEVAWRAAAAGTRSEMLPVTRRWARRLLVTCDDGE